MSHQQKENLYKKNEAHEDIGKENFSLFNPTKKQWKKKTSRKNEIEKNIKKQHQWIKFYDNSHHHYRQNSHYLY